jgi:hypothetical protein
MIIKHSRCLAQFFFLSILTASLLFQGCDKSGEDSPINNNDWVEMGSQEGMIYQEYAPPLVTSGGYPVSEIIIYPDTNSVEYIRFHVYQSGPTGCRNYKQEVNIGGSESMSFRYHYEEHTEYHSAKWKAYVYTWDGVEIDSVFEHMNSFKESESPLGQRGINVLSVFHFEDRIFNERSFTEGGSLSYISDSRLDYSVDTNPSSACRMEPDSSYMRNDTAFVYFTEQIRRFEYNLELYNPDGVYVVFKLIEKGRERLGWLKLTTTGRTASVSGCAIQK